MTNTKSRNKKSARPSTGKVGRSSREFVDDLRQLGFTDYEAKVYLILLGDNPATAYEVAKAAGLPRANVYSAFDGLAKKGAVQPVSENPTRYAPIDPRVTFDAIARDTSNLCTQISTKLASLSPTQSRDYVWYLSGEENIHRKITEILTSAQRHIWIKAHESALSGHVADLRAAAKRGVRLLVILFGYETGQKFDLGPNAEVYLHEGTGVVVGLGQSLITVTTDFRNALTANLERNANGAFTQSQPVVNLAESVIRHEVYLAEIFAHFGDNITDEFGLLMQRLRRKYLPSDQIKTLDQAVKKLAKDKTLSPVQRDVLTRNSHNS
jgi:predicted transcriptional regulator